MKFSLLLGCAAIVCFADVAVAKTPAEIEAIAKAVTVEIKLTRAAKVGSGIIVHRQGDLYTLITNSHVVCGRNYEQGKLCRSIPTEETYSLGLSGGQQLTVKPQAVKLLGNDLDLAIVQFRSSRSYPVAQVAEPGSLKVGDKIFTSGYPLGQSGFSFNSGKSLAVVNKRLTGDGGGYTVIYDAETQPGMSGGGVFDQAGRLVAVHGQGDRFRDNSEVGNTLSSNTKVEKAAVNSKTGYNRGIPVRWIVQNLAMLGVALGDRQPVAPAQASESAATADEFFITGFNRLVVMWLLAKQRPFDRFPKQFA
jgi:S1-C subfamily serine protease